MLYLLMSGEWAAGPVTALRLWGARLCGFVSPRRILCSSRCLKKRKQAMVRSRWCKSAAIAAGAFALAACASQSDVDHAQSTANQALQQAQSANQIAQQAAQTAQGAAASANRGAMPSR